MLCISVVIQDERKDCVSDLRIFFWFSRPPKIFTYIWYWGRESVNYISQLVKWLPAQFYQLNSIEGDHKAKELKKKKGIFLFFYFSLKLISWTFILEHFLNQPSDTSLQVSEAVIWDPLFWGLKSNDGAPPLTF